MPNYYRNENAQPDGYHEVHVDDGSCTHPPDLANRQSIGWHASCVEAVAHAKVNYDFNHDGCAYCVPLCHTR